MKRSLQSTMGFGLLLSLLLVFAILWKAVNDSIRQVAEQYVETRLEHDAESLLAASLQTADKVWSVDHRRLSANYSRPFSGYYYKISIGTQRILSRSLWDIDLNFLSENTNNSSATFIPGPQDQNLLLINRQYVKLGKPIYILVAEDFSAIDKDIHTLQIKLAIIAATLLLLLIFLQNGLLRFSLNPLKKTSRELLMLERGDIRQLDEAVPKEIIPLVIEINHLFSTMSQRLQRSRNTIGDLSHSLKKPLTVLQNLVSDNFASTTEESVRIYNTQLTSIKNIIDRNLKKARLAGDGPGGANFRIDKDLNDLINTIRMMYPKLSIKLMINSMNVDLLPYDRDDMYELLGNIIDNAAKWASDIVQISISQKKDTIKFIIEDDGPGVPDELISSLTGRGMRLDETIEGQGIGLAIANDIVSEYSGSLSFQKSQLLQGLHVKINLPLQQY